MLAAGLAGAGFEMTGVDPSAGMLDVMRARAPEVESVQANGDELPFADGSFQLVLRSRLCITSPTRPPFAGRSARWFEWPRRAAASSSGITIRATCIGSSSWPACRRTRARSGWCRRTRCWPGCAAAGARVLDSSQLGLVPDFVPPRALAATAALERLVERSPLRAALRPQRRASGEAAPRAAPRSPAGGPCSRRRCAAPPSGSPAGNSSALDPRGARCVDDEQPVVWRVARRPAHDLLTRNHVVEHAERPRPLHRRLKTHHRVWPAERDVDRAERPGAQDRAVDHDIDRAQPPHRRTRQAP